jgi:hypothetical protein
VREITVEWLDRYNEIRPHDVLGRLPPARYREQVLAAKLQLRTVYWTGKLTTPGQLLRICALIRALVFGAQVPVRSDIPSQSRYE